MNALLRTALHAVTLVVPVTLAPCGAAPAVGEDNGPLVAWADQPHVAKVLAAGRLIRLQDVRLVLPADRARG